MTTSIESQALAFKEGQHSIEFTIEDFDADLLDADLLDLKDGRRRSQRRKNLRIECANIVMLAPESDSPAKKRKKRAGHGAKMYSTDKNMVTRMAGERPGFCTETKLELLALAAKNKTHPPTTMAGSGMQLLQQRVFGLCTEFSIAHDQVCLFTDLLANTMLQPADEQLEFLRGHNAAVRVLMYLHTPVVYPGRAAQDLNTDAEEKSSTWHTIHGMVRD
jgi:hypothetical protein